MCVERGEKKKEIEIGREKGERQGRATEGDKGRGTQSEIQKNRELERKRK